MSLLPSLWRRRSPIQAIQFRSDQPPPKGVAPDSGGEWVIGGSPYYLPVHDGDWVLLDANGLAFDVMDNEVFHREYEPAL